MYRVLRDRRFAALAAGHALNGIGSWTALIAIWGYAAYEFGLGAGQLGFLALAWGLPPVLLGAVAGVSIDRFGPRRVAVVADLGNAAVAIAMIGAGDVTTLLGLTVLHGVGKAFAQPAYAALPARAVDRERLFDANALFSAAGDLAMVVGPVVAAAVIATVGPEAAFAVDAATYVLGAAAAAQLRLRPLTDTEAVAAAGAWTQVRDGLRLVRATVEVRVLFGLSFSLWLSFGAFIVLEPVFVRDVLGEPVTTFALLQSAFGVGLVGTGMALPALRGHLSSPGRMGVVIVGAGVAATAYAGTSVLAVTFTASFAWGVTVALFSAPSRTLLLQRTPASAHGRVLGAWQAVNSLGQLLPALAVPVLAVVGAQASLVGAGVLLTGAGAVGAHRVRARPTWSTVRATERNRSVSR